MKKSKTLCTSFFTAILFFTAVISLYALSPGDRVSCNWKNRGTYYKGKVASVDGNRILIHYDDGDKEWTTENFCKLLGTPGGIDRNGTSAAFKANDEVLVNKGGYMVRAWIVRTDGPDHSIVAFTWNGESVKRYANSELKLNRYPSMNESQKQLRGYKAYKTGKYSLASGRYGKYIIMIHGGGEIVLFDRETMEPYKKADMGMNIQASAVSTDGNLLALAGHSGKEIYIYSVPDLQLKQKISTAGDCRLLSFSSRNRLALYSPGRGLYIHDLTDNSVSGAQFNPEKGMLYTSMAFDSSGDNLYCGTEIRAGSRGNPSVRIFGVSGTKLSPSGIIAVPDNVNSLSVSEDERHLAIGGKNSISIASLNSGKIILSRRMNIENIRTRFSPDNSTVVFASGSGSSGLYVLKRDGALKKLPIDLPLCEDIRFVSGSVFFASRRTVTNFGETVVQRITIE